MFGGGGSRRNNNNNRNESLSAAMTPENPPSGRGGNSVTGFDPEGLERAAKAARDLDSSRNAKSAIDLIKAQEATKQVCVHCMYIHTDGHGYIYTCNVVNANQGKPSCRFGRMLFPWSLAFIVMVMVVMMLLEPSC